MATELTQEEIQRRRSEGETIILIERSGPEDASRYVNEQGVFLGRPPGEDQRQREYIASVLGIPTSTPPAQTEVVVNSDEQPQDVVDNRDPAKMTKDEKTFRQISPETTPPAPSKPPGFGMSRPTIVESLMSQGKKDLVDNHPEQNAQRGSGFFNTLMTEPVPAYNSTNAEKVIRGETNTYIILGRDRPSDENSGKGATPNTHVGCIDIIAGMSGIMAREVDITGDKVLTNKSPQLDAARIYISQRADIDSPEYFSLAEGKVGNLTNRSAIAIKADSVRIIGREGIKLVTSTDTYNGSAGMFIGDNIQGVDIIAGNDDRDLQPMVKGDDLAKILDDTVKLIADAQSTAAFNMESICTIIFAMLTQNPYSFGTFSSIIGRLPLEISNLLTQEINFAFHKLNYSNKNPFAKYNFRSKYNNVN